MASTAVAQDTSMIATSRKTVWSSAGVTPATRTTICTTLSPGASAGTINAALASCPSGQVVQLGAGNFSIGGGILIEGHNNVTLRGMGPDATTIRFSGYETCGGLGAGICVQGGGSRPFVPDTPRNLANWTSGYSQGATSIVLSTVANLQIGSLIVLDQLDDSTPDQDAPVNCANRAGSTSTYCSGEGAGNLSMDTQRLQNEVHKVTGIAGTTVTISPGLHWPNWTSGKSPHAWWGSSTPISGIGIEDLKLDATDESCGLYLSSCGGILFNYAQESWVKNVEVLKMPISQVKLYESNQITVRDSYFHTSKTLTSGAYGIVCFYCGNSLIENNIIQDIVASILIHGAGNVVAYNYTLDNSYNPTGAPFPPGNSQMQAGAYQHNGGAGMNLWEGNDSNSFKADAIHGTQNFSTVFRNRFSGYEFGKSAHTNPIFIYAWNRYFNLIGNVLGDDSHQTVYSGSFANNTIYRLGETPYYEPWISGPPGSFTDSRVAGTLFRWCNYETVTDSTTCSSSEVPTGLSAYANTTPGSSTLPSSFYLGSAPGFFTTLFGTVSFPPIGKDITGGTITGTGGHAKKIPARVCYENQPNNGANPALMTSFNANECYGSGGGGGDTTSPVVVITAPNGGSAYSTSTTPLTTLAWTATDDSGVVSSCTCASSTGASCTATGTTSGTASAIVLSNGLQTLSVTCVDAAGNPGTDPQDVTYTPPPPPTAPIINRVRVQGEGP